MERLSAIVVQNPRSGAIFVESFQLNTGKGANKAQKKCSILNIFQREWRKPTKSEVKCLSNLAITRCGPTYFCFTLFIHGTFSLCQEWKVFFYIFSFSAFLFSENSILLFLQPHCTFKSLTGGTVPPPNAMSVLKNQLLLQHHRNYLCPDTNHLHETLVCFSAINNFAHI